MMFKEFKVQDVLNVEQTLSVVAKSDLIDGNIPYVTRTVSNNGYTRTCGNTDKVNKGNCITIGAETGVAFYQPEDFVAGNKIYRLSREGLSEKEYLYLASILNKRTNEYSYSNARIPEKIKAEMFSLPVIPSSDASYAYTPADIDWQYMRDRITELERDRITELDAYLKAAGLDDYELTEEDKKVLSQHSHASVVSSGSVSDQGGAVEGDSGIRWKEFRIGDLFEKCTIKGIPKAKENLVENKNGYHIFGQNIHYQHPQKVLNDKKYLQIVNPEHPILAYTSSVGEIGMISESFYRSGDNGAFQGLFPKFVSTEKNIEYLLAFLKKRFTDFGYATSMKNILDIQIPLPVTQSGEPDWDYMERYIRAIEKQVIRGVVEWKNKVIEETKEVVMEKVS